MDKPLSLNFEDFSLTKGGPFFKLMVRSGLIKPDFARPIRRATLLALIIWPPMFIFSALQGLAFYGRGSLPNLCCSSAAPISNSMKFGLSWYATSHYQKLSRHKNLRQI